MYGINSLKTFYKRFYIPGVNGGCNNVSVHRVSINCTCFGAAGGCWGWICGFGGDFWLCIGLGLRLGVTDLQVNIKIRNGGFRNECGKWQISCECEINSHHQWYTFHMDLNTV